MTLTYLLLGLGAKIVTGLDDVIVHIPLLSSVTKRRKGQIIFSLGTFTAIIVAIIMSTFLATLIKNFSYYHYITSGLLFLLAAGIYFDLFVHTPKKKVEEKYQKIKIERMLSLFGIGFISSMATILDDVIVFIPFFINGFKQSFYTSVGILMATIVEIIVVIFFASRIMKLKYKEEITSFSLVIFGLLVLFKII